MREDTQFNELHMPGDYGAASRNIHNSSISNAYKSITLLNLIGHQRWRIVLYVHYFGTRPYISSQYSLSGFLMKSLALCKVIIPEKMINNLFLNRNAGLSYISSIWSMVPALQLVLLSGDGVSKVIIGTTMKISLTKEPSYRSRTGVEFKMRVLYVVR